MKYENIKIYVKIDVNPVRYALIREGFTVKKVVVYILISLIFLLTVGCRNITRDGEFKKGGDKSNLSSDEQKNEDKTTDILPVVGVSPDTPSDRNSLPPSSGQQEEEVKKPAPEVPKKIVVIDPGHANRSNLEKEANAPGSTEMKIKDGGGAAGIHTKTPEYVINMEVSKRLQVLLEEKGFKVIMTKTEHSVSLGNIERAEIGNSANANLVIRIHCDSSNNSTINGASMFVPDVVNENTKAIYDESKRCGQVVLNTLTSKVGMRNRGLIFSKEMTGFNWSKVPVILVEMGFLSNPEEDKLLSTSSYQEKLSQALADGIEEALK